MSMPDWLMTLHNRLADAQWDAPETIAERQMAEVAPLLAHAWETVPGQRERLEEAGYRPGIVPDWALWRRIAPMDRGPMQEAPAVWRSLAPPRGHGEVVSVASSGSTGAPLRIAGTMRDAAISKAFTLRFHLWHDIDMTKTRASIREARDPACQPPEGRTHPRWGDGMEYPVPTGPSHEIDIHSGIEVQAQWLKRRRPQYLLAFPSNIADLARHFDKETLGFETLDRVMTISEVVTPELRQLVREAWGVECVDVYSARECGPLAFQCPDVPEGSDTPGYFVQAERVILEVLREDGTPAAAGETGRVVVTMLHNYAQPMIRYAVGDYAVAGSVGADGRSPCGRGLPRLEAVRGRVRNMLIAADGRRFWPSFMTSGLFGKLPIRQHQFIQRAPGRLEAHLVVWRPFDAGEEAYFIRHVGEALPGPWEIAVEYCDEIPRGPGGKFEDCYVELR